MPQTRHFRHTATHVLGALLVCMAAAASAVQPSLGPGGDWRSDWDRVKHTRDIDIVRDYIRLYPQSPRALQAIKLEKSLKRNLDKLESALWSAVRDSQDAAVVRSYLEKYPQGRYVGEANAKLRAIEDALAVAVEDALWNSVRDSGDKTLLQTYLRKYPRGRHAGEADAAIEALDLAAARVQADELFWRSIEGSGNLALFRDYLEKFPDGRHTQAADARIQELSRPPEPLIPTATLEVQADPPTARVRILNISERYSPGMQLPSDGKYQVEVTHPGYEKHLYWIALRADERRVHRVKLNRVAGPAPAPAEPAVVATPPPPVPQPEPQQQPQSPPTSPSVVVELQQAPPPIAPVQQCEPGRRTTAEAQCRALLAWRTKSPCDPAAKTECQDGDCIHGVGTWSYGRGGSCYRGEMDRGRRQGEGLMIHRQGWIYEGNWQASRKTGQGTYLYPPRRSGGERCFSGEWRRDRPFAGLKIDLESGRCALF